MDSKIISKLFFLIIIFSTTQLNAIEFKGKFLQGHYIIGITDPSSEIIIDKKKVKVSSEGYFVFGIDRDRKFDLEITEINNGKKNNVIKKVFKRKYNIQRIDGLPENKVTPPAFIPMVSSLTLSSHSFLTLLARLIFLQYFTGMGFINVFVL